MRLALAAFLALGAASAASPTLKDATADQDTRFRSAFETVNKWVRDGAFPGATLAIGHRGSLIALKAFGKTQYMPDAPAVIADEMYDLASVSKVIGTTTAAAILYEERKLELDAPVVRYVPEFDGAPGHNQITIRELLTHSSGIPTPGLMYEKASNKAGILKQIYAVNLASPPGAKFVYRDPNFILLGDAVERVSGKPLNEFLQAHVFRPLGMSSTGYNPPASRIERIAPTEMQGRRVVHGHVHDENCYVMGGVCGHAGLFSTAHDLAVYAQMLLNGGAYGHKRILKASTVDLFMKRQDLPPGSSRALGWDTPATGCFAGDLASPHAIIHTGFTGTSVYIDPDSQVFIILLTNRVHPTRQNEKIAKARPEIHSAVLQAIH
jgi:serine-type D-Ala-D-Ala carboxypeptidase